MTEAPSLSVVIPTHDRAERLPALLEALERQTLDPDRFEVVLVDDASSDETPDVLADLARSTTVALRVHRLPENRRQAHARNVGWAATTSPVLAFTDDDCIPDPTWLAVGLATLEEAPGSVGVVQGAVHPEVERRRTFSATREVRELSLLFEGCNLFVRREALEATGGFDERFAVLCEDASMGWSILEAGWTAEFAPDAVVRHAVTRPPLRWHLRDRWREHHLVTMAKLHPQFRREVCWRWWCFRPENARFLLALAGLAGATRRPAMAAAALPWLTDRWPGGRVSRAAFEHVGKRALTDAVVAAAMVYGSARERTLLL